jgi:hypothetical protein
MSFRLNHYQLAKALRILLTLEPNQPIASLSQMAKIIIIDWIAKHSINTTLETSQADIEAVKLISTLNVNQIDPYTTIKNIMNQAKQQSQPFQYSQQVQQIKQKSAQQIQRELEEERIFYEIKHREMEKANQIKNAQLTESQLKEIDAQIARSNQIGKRILHEAPQELETDSIISTVNDFSPPKEWIE